MSIQKRKKLKAIRINTGKSFFYVWRTRKRAIMWIASDLSASQITLSARLVCTQDEINFVDELVKGWGI